MTEKVNILGVNIDILTMEIAIEKVKLMLKDNKVSTIFTPNSEIIMSGYKDEGFKDILNSADLLVADGIGVVYASKILKKPVPERVAGFDLACNIVDFAAKSETSIFLFGSKPGIAEVARDKLTEKYKGIKIAGINNGYFKDEDNESIIDKINNSGADILFVCLGAPKQENWMFENKDKLNVKICMGLGGALDVWAGAIKRAPEAWQKMGLEWFYRLAKQPTRIGRMMELPKFALTVVTKGNKFKQK